MPVLALSTLIVAVRHRSLRPLLAAAAGAVLLMVTVIPAKILTGRAGPGQPPVAPLRAQVVALVKGLPAC